MARCILCGWTVPSFDLTSQQAAEDEMNRHVQNALRARAALQRSNPSLKSQRDYYLEQTRNPYISDADRSLWKTLADELTHRIGPEGSPSEREVALPFD